MASKTEGASRYYYRGDSVVYPYEEGSASSNNVFTYFAGGAGYQVATPRLAATVMLLRDAPDGGGGPQDDASEGAAQPLDQQDGEPRVFMLHRVASMAFAADAYVFPGGRVDAADSADGVPWDGPDAQEWAGVLGVEPDVAASVVVAAARELYEECGVLMAGDASGRVGVERDARSLEERRMLAAHETTLAQVLADRGMRLRTDLLRPHSRWVTPVAEPRRYDTFFFKAILPEGVQADGLTSEANEARWVRPGRILQRFEDDLTLLLPPTIFHLRKLQKAGSAQAFLASASDMSPVLSESAIVDGKAVAVCPRA